MLSLQAFSWLIVILRALYVNVDRTNMHTAKFKFPVTRNCCTLVCYYSCYVMPLGDIEARQDYYYGATPYWPTLTDEEWIRVEASLKDLILADYGKKNK